MASTSNVVWKLEQDAETNEEYKSIKANLQNVIKQCHDLLYGSASIVGVKAQNDIMRILCLVIFRPYFQDENSPLWKKYLEIKENNSMIEKYIDYCKDLSLITKEDRVDNKWSQLVKHCLVHLLPSIYSSSDEKFNCEDVNTLTTIIGKLSALQIDENFIDAFATSCGDVHEAFRAYGGGKGAKEFGQYFTPRHLIHLIFHGLGLRELMSEMEDISVYDPCMGAGGFVTRMYTLADVKPENVYGCEIENDTIKFGEAAVVLATKSTESNIVRCNSLCENKFLFTKKMNVIATNPPFGTKMNYNVLENKFNEFTETNFPASTLKFKDIYPIKTNNGACLFVQHCVYMLKEGGVCAIVLPDGELFDGSVKWAKAFRKWLCENAKILKILKVPCGAFEHAGVKTNVVVFAKNGPTQDIQYLQTNKECDEVTKLCDVSHAQLETNAFSFDLNAYVERLNKVFAVPSFALNKVCTFNNGKTLKISDMVAGDYPVIGGGKQPKGFHAKYNRDENTILCSSSGAYAGHISRYPTKVWADDCFSIDVVDKNVLDETYLYFYLVFNQDSIYAIQPPSAGQPHVYSRDMHKIMIPLPSLEIQQKIVQELSDIEESINTVKTRIEQMKREKELYFKHGRTAEIRELLKSSEEKTLGEICSIEIGGTPSRNVSEYWNGNNLWVSVRELNSSTITDTIEKITDLGVKKSSVKLFAPGTILYSFKLSIGKVGIAGKPLYTNEAIAGIVPKDKEYCDDWYLYYYLMFDLCSAKGKGMIGNGSLNKSSLQQLKIQVPQVEIQRKFIKIYKEKETYLNTLQERIEKGKEFIVELKQLGKDIIASHCG